jgi:hypothetical protein
MRENPLGGKAGHADQAVQARADRDDAAADRREHRERKTHPQACKEAEITVQTFLPLAERVRRSEDGPGEATQGTGGGSYRVRF